jgi:murein L,D-transpeptidase YafK
MPIYRRRPSFADPAPRGAGATLVRVRQRAGRVAELLLIGCALVLPGVGVAATPQSAAVPAALRADSILIVKSEHRLYLMKEGWPLHSYPIALGLTPVGAKYREGDFRTPEGHYIVDARNLHSKFYRALRLSYPNAEDLKRAAARHAAPGGIVEIHGQPNLKHHPSSYYATHDWTNGCIALSNEDLQDVWDLTADRIPVEILATR